MHFPHPTGPRGCIGRSFAEMEGQIVLATLLQRVVFEPVASDPIQPEPVTTLWLKQPLLVRVQRDEHS